MGGHVRFASAPLGPTPSGRRASAGDAGTDMEQIRRLRSRSDINGAPNSVDWTAGRRPGGAAGMGNTLTVPVQGYGRAREPGAGGLSRPSDLDLTGPPARAASTSPRLGTFVFPSRPSPPGVAEAAPRAASLHPPRFVSTPLPRANGAVPVPTPARPTVGEAKTLLVQALNRYDCPLEDKLRVLRKLALEVQDELIASAAHVPPRPASTGPSSGPSAGVPDLGEAMRASRAKALAISHLQKAAQEQKAASPNVVRRR